MHIAGGLYRESCLVPEWNAEFGSGGRAAAAVATLSPGSVLHTYAKARPSPGQLALQYLGIDVRVHAATHGVAFAYLHPLANPHIEPRRSSMTQHSAIPVGGDAVLRFGFLEGDAVVDARRAVYDPQTSIAPAPFEANGSRADELALVLNESELRALAGVDDTRHAVRTLLEVANVAVVVVKAGARGALVAERGGAMAEIPAYRSERVFKISTGDVLSGIFALEWAERGKAPADAADLASRRVAAYCSNGNLPLPAGMPMPDAAIVWTRTPVVRLEGKVDSLARRFVMEEARSSLVDLGAIVVCPSLDAESPASRPRSTAALVIVDAASGPLWPLAQQLLDDGMSVVVLDELGLSVMPAPWVQQSRLMVTGDFASAMYFALWAAATSAD